MAQRFTPVRGKDADIRKMGYNEGYVYFAIDTGFIYLDMNGEKHTLGGSGTGGGSSFVWADAEEDVDLLKVSEDEEDMNYTMVVTAIEGSTEEDPHYPQTGLLVINSDGRFFRVTGDNAEQGLVNLYLIAVSGNGTGGGGSTPTIVDLDLTWSGIDLLGSTFIFEKDNPITFYPSSTADEICSLSIRVIDETEEEVYREDFRVRNNTKCVINASSFPIGNNLTLVATVVSDHSTYNKGRGLTKTFKPIKVLKMYLDKPTDIGMIGIQSGAARLSYIPYFTGLGTTTNPVKVYYSVDNEDSVFSKNLIADNDQNKQYIDIPHQLHGVHVIKLWLSVNINNQNFTSESISYEVPYVDQNNDDPIIWIQEELGTVVQYEQAVVKYMVYSASAALTGSKIEVQFLQDGVLFDTAEIEYSTRWQNLDLTSKYTPGDNYFSIVCGSARKDINFYITTEGARNLALKHEDEIEFSFDSMGRSNKQIKANRTRWIATGRHAYAPQAYEAELNNFNWYNNGWLDDNNGMGSYLAVSNGASVSIPTYSNLTINTADQPWTFEMRFRVRNAKKFATLVTEIPIYKYTLNGVENAPGEEKTLDEILEIGGEVLLDSDGNKVMNEANTTRKEIRTDKYIAFKYLNNANKGFAIGTQEAYFNVGGRVVNVKYREDEIINISFVIDKNKNQLSIYLNGILSGVGDLSGIEGFTMPNIPFTISSEYCDFDLYKFRAYPIALSMPEVIHNYISDMKNVDLYDENQLTDVNDDTKLSYTKLLAYNENHPDSPTMPYVVIDMTGETSTGNTELPYAKTAKGIDGTRIVFTNACGDALLDAGTVTPWEYYTHCPSYEADNVNINVQGTSSQIYPRRNFKTKFKKSKNWNYTYGPLKGKSVAKAYYFNTDGTFAESVQSQVDAIQSQIDDGSLDKTAGKAQIKSLTTGLKTLTKNWHEDSESIGTNKFTWKVDYMESSGSYNTGFANLMGSIYDKHPLEDLNLNGIDPDNYRTSVYGFPMLAFHRTGENEYTYIGRYNCNLDKSANERYGFELEVEQPYVTLTKETENGTESYHPLIADIAECWELRDNQGTWCSFRYPSEMRAAGFRAEMANSTPEQPRIEVVQHFEARYHKYADQFEWGQNVILGKENTDDFSDEVGAETDTATICNYLLNKLQNLEVLFNWLDSTDTRSATNEILAVPVNYKVLSKVSNEEAAAQGITYYTQTVDGSEINIGTFTKDSIEYRRQKFYNEFDQHLDKHYCAVYFVMTELLLCYDSRGKNMMIATFGPREAGGDYIWYPIFYDIDTQLGLNNVGAKLWDYDEDCSENGTFSTAQSVLWTNFYDLFKGTIIATYTQLRGGGDSATLSYKNIEGAYTCDPDVFKSSLAMKGRRPIIAMGLDEYYKYVLPVTQAWRNQEGRMITANYLYACQGDRKLSRELLINNRLLYMDSKWLGGTFTISTGGMAGVMFRSTGNHVGTTSDKYIDSDIIGTGQEKATYPVPYFDATPEYNVTPYLKFYITTFTDENTYQNTEAYDEERYPNGMPTITAPSVVEAYRSGRVDQQLNYFAGSSYISSLGDLSTKYANQVKIPNTPRLLDITLGSDVPGYFNNENLNPFELYTEVDDTTGLVKDGCEKPLLNKIILSNLQGLSTFLDVRSPDKLTEFRALGTSLTYALFAEGAPLTTVHLPSTVERLIFIQNKNLTNLIDSTPTILDMVNGVAVYRDPDTYKGLFIDGLTNYTIANPSTLRDNVGSAISEIDIEGDALGYGSYELLTKTVAKKNGTGRGNQLKIKMIDVNWTPYTQVEYGEEKDDNITYYYLTDHSTYTEYNAVNVPDMNWLDDTLNGKVFTYDNTAPKNTIEDLQLLQVFIDDYNSATGSTVNQFVNNVSSMMGQKTYPTLTGNLFVANANGAPISETAISEIYGTIWPELVIRAENVEKSYLTKYVEIDANSGKEVVLDSNKFSDTPELKLTDKKVPSRANYDFIGFSPDKPSVSNPVIYVKRNDTNTAWEFTSEGAAATIDSTTKTIVLYAIYQPHEYVARFNFNDKNDNPTIIEVTTPWSNTIGINEPHTMPKKEYDVSDLEYLPDGKTLGLYRTYKFLGWAYESNPEQIVDLSKLKPDQNRRFIALYDDVSVYDNVADEKYFTVTYDGELRINPNYNGVLSGKVTIPATINGVKYTAIGTFSGAENPAITHIFFEQKENKSTPTSISSGAFDAMSNLVYFQMPESIIYIGSSAFANTSLGSTDNSQGVLIAQMFTVGKELAVNSFVNILTIKTLDLGSAQHIIGNEAFGNMRNLQKIIIGSPDNPSALTLANLAGGTGMIFGGQTGRGIDNGAGSVEIFLADDDAEAMFNAFDYRANKYVLTAHS